MNHRQFLLLMMAPALAATLSGCGVWSAWMQRNSDAPPQTAYHDGASAQAGPIQPGHSTDPDVFNENYDPYGTGTLESDRFAPPPAPPIRPRDLPPGPASEGESHAELAPDAEGQLIKTLKTPRIFSPEGVRSIYDRWRASDSPEQAIPSKGDGPIAQHMMDESATRPCLYSESQSSGPVHLGIPEVNGHPVAERSSLSPAATGRAAVTQASPSSFKHPMFADPTGVPYAAD